jgi:TonB family protein
MNAMFIYLVESAICLLVLFPVYWFFLRRDTFFRLNRFYLLAMVLLSMLVPLIPFHLVSPGPPSAFVIALDPVLITPAKVQQTLTEHIQWVEIATVVYCTGMLIFFLRFALQLFQLFRITRRFGIRKNGDQQVIFVDRGYSPFSFFNLIFINEEMIPAGSLPAILEHEKVHIRQRHTFDMILIELAAIIQWFNPVIWLAGREMKILHEYLADEGVLQTGISHTRYQQMILDETMGIPVNGLTNNFNVSILKKRIVMMTKVKSGTWSVSKLVFVLPALLIVWFMLTAKSFSNIVKEKIENNPALNLGQSDILPDTTVKNVPVKPNDDRFAPVVMEDNRLVYNRPDVQPEYPGGDEARINFLRSNIKYPQDAIKAGIHGKVFVTFIVEKDGKVTHVKILRGIGKSCDEEAFRVVKMMPNWIPGKAKGENVAVRFNLPIKFAFDSEIKKKSTK